MNNDEKIKIGKNQIKYFEKNFTIEKVAKLLGSCPIQFSYKSSKNYIEDILNAKKINKINILHLPFLIDALASKKDITLIY